MKDIEKKSDKDLAKFLEEKRTEIRSFRFKAAGIRDTEAVREAKKDVARALTEMNARAKRGKVVPEAEVAETQA